MYESTSSQVTFAVVALGLLGRDRSVVPLAAVSPQGGTVVVPYDRDLVRHAPHGEIDRQLTSPEEHRLHRHYGLASGTASTSGPTPGLTPAWSPGRG